MSRVLIICSSCGGDPVNCSTCDGAGTLVLNKNDLQDTDIVIDPNYDEVKYVDAEAP